LPHKSEETTDSGNRPETVELPSRDELTKLTKPLSESHLAIVEGATRHLPPDVNHEPWQTAMDGLRAFLAAGHGDEAERLGWPKDELYDVPPVWARVDLCGTALAIGDHEVVGITPNEIRIRTASRSTLAFYRKPAIDYAVAYRARIKQLGDDGLKEEPRLRALEAVVNLYRSHHPSIDIDTAKATVLDAIGARTP
jgi:hypothetical protein